MLRSISRHSRESVKSVLKKKKSCNGKNLHKRKVLSLKWKSEGVMDDESGESLEPMEKVPLKELGESELERLVCSWWREAGRRYRVGVGDGVGWSISDNGKSLSLSLASRSDVSNMKSGEQSSSSKYFRSLRRSTNAYQRPVYRQL